MKPTTAILLLNLGTPDSPKKSDVRSYLTQFLNDPRVIDIPWLARTLLVNGIIVPFRSGNSSKLYKAIWDEKTGSPLLFHSQNLADKLQLCDVGVREEIFGANPRLSDHLPIIADFNI